MYNTVLINVKFFTTPCSKYAIVAINERSDLVITLSADVFNRFKQIRSKYFIETSVQPVSDEIICETELIRPESNRAPNCSKATLNVVHPLYLFFNLETKYMG